MAVYATKGNGRKIILLLLFIIVLLGAGILLIDFIGTIFGVYFPIPGLKYIKEMSFKKKIKQSEEPLLLEREELSKDRERLSLLEEQINIRKKEVQLKEIEVQKKLELLKEREQELEKKAKILEDREHQFKDRQIQEDFDSITGATISSTAVIDSIKEKAIKVLDYGQ